MGMCSSVNKKKLSESYESDKHISMISELSDLKSEKFSKFDFNGVCCPCRVIDIYDGDTCNVGIKWDDKYIQLRLRLKGINTAEIKPKKNIENRDRVIEDAYFAKKKLIEFCTDICPKDCKSKKECVEIMEKNKKILYVKMYHFDVFGRVVSELYLDSEYKQCVNTKMVDEGYAIKFDKYE